MGDMLVMLVRQFSFGCLGFHQPEQASVLCAFNHNVCCGCISVHAAGKQTELQLSGSRVA